MKEKGEADMSEKVSEKVNQLPGIGKIHAAIAAIMGEVGGVAKTRKNDAQGYKFRGIADITLACQPVMAKHGVHVVPHEVLTDEVTERKTSKGTDMLHIRQRIVFRFYHADGSFVPCVTTGEAMDSGDKSSNKVMAAALKYALTQTFCIPEDDPEQDTETASPEIGEKKAAPAPAPAAAVGLPPADALTDDEIQNVAALAKRAGLQKHGDLKPLLKEIAGSDSLRLFHRRYLSDLVTTLERKGDALAEQDIAEVFGPKAANA